MTETKRSRFASDVKVKMAGGGMSATGLDRL